MDLHDLYFRYVTLIKFICFLFRWYFWQIVVRMVSCQMKFTTLLGIVLMLTLLVGLMGALLTNWLNDNAGNAVAVSDINIRKVLCIELSVALSFMIIIILSSKWKRKPAQRAFNYTSAKSNALKKIMILKNRNVLFEHIIITYQAFMVDCAKSLAMLLDNVRW